MSYVELHCHSAFSMLDGASTPEALIARARTLGYTTLALTDHDDLGGAVRFTQAAIEPEQPKIEAIIGAELTVEFDPADAEAADPQGRHHLVLLAETVEGYANLSTLITRARMDRPRGHPSVPLETVASHARGLYALSGCPRGLVPSRIARGDVKGAMEGAGTLHEIFDGRFAIECWDHGLPEERAIVPVLQRIAHSLGTPWIVTNDVHYAESRGRVTHDVLCALRHERSLDEMGTRLRPNGEWSLRSPARMARRWRGQEDGLRATLAIAERCAFRMIMLEPSLPAFPLPPGITADEYLEQLVWQGASERWGDAREAKHELQIEHELAMIRRMDLAGFFLIVWDIVRFSRREGILCQGRGSAANSAVCYCLGITAVDPIRLGLLFERFLSEERAEAPDIDIDFAHRDRERVLQYVYQRYGREHAAMVCEQITYRGRSAVRDAARVLGFSVEQANALSTLSDRFSARATGEALRSGPPAIEDGPRATGHGPRSDQLVAMRLGQQMIGGTEATTQARATKEESRKQSLGIAASSSRPKGDRHKDATKEKLTSADRPKPYASYEPYGSTPAREIRFDAYAVANATHDSELRGPRPEARGPQPGYQDPHAELTHNERRNPTTAFRPTEEEPGTLLQRAGLDANDRRVQVLADVVAGLHQLPRHRSIHVGGFVLTREPLARVVPVEPASMQDRTVIQWEKDDLDPAGLVKIDLLGLGMLTVIQDCLRYIRLTRGVTIDLGQLDMDDQAVYDDLCAADTVGVFQVESRAQMNTLPRLKPRQFYDLVVEVALIRPGPIQGEMVHPYLRRKAGEEEVTYLHPSLKPILERTLGVPLFQEQGMQVAIAAAGFTPGEADKLRRAMGHKRSHERMAAICERMIDGMRKNGIPEDDARRIYNQIHAFADYGFPESHAASFALIVYASAYLRHYYPAEYVAAMLNAQPMGFYSPSTLIEDAKRHGVKVRPVNLRRSVWDHSLELTDGRVMLAKDGVVGVVGTGDSGLGTGDWGLGTGEQGTKSEHSPFPIPHSQHPNSRHAAHPPVLRLGLRSIRGLGPKARERLERALEDGPFVDVHDVIRRTALDSRALRLLAEAGAFDSMFRDLPRERRRRAALWAVLDARRGDAGPLAPRAPSPPSARVPAMTPLDLTEADFRVTGLSLTGHPMRHLRRVLSENGVLTAEEAHDPAKCRDGNKVAVAGLVICRQRPGTAKGFVFLTLEDETGMVNIVVTPKRFERQALLISTSPLLLVRGTVQVEQTVVNVRGEQFRPLEARVGAEHAWGHDFH